MAFIILMYGINRLLNFGGITKSFKKVVLGFILSDYNIYIFLS